MTSVEQLVDMPYGVQRAAVLAVGVLLWLQVGLENRFEHQHCGQFRDTIFYDGNSERPLSTPGLVYHYPPYRLGLIGSPFQLFRQFVQPSLHTVLLDVLELLTVHSGRSTIRTAAVVGTSQNILPVHLVIQGVESI